ncbi:MAG: RHS repeat-associated core domain-containing protein, partial [Luteimonas sp.]
ANDGRQIVLAYGTDGRLTTATVPGPTTPEDRVWSYQYVAPGNFSLSSVTNPDGSKWQYAGGVPNLLSYAQDSNGPIPLHPAYCTTTNILQTPDANFVVTAPSGAQATYTFTAMSHGRTNVKYSCLPGDDDGDGTEFNRFAMFHDVMTLKSKSISGPALISGTYNYLYESLDGGYRPTGDPDTDALLDATPAPHYKTVTVTEPDGTQQVNLFGKDSDLNEGQLLRIDTKKAGVTYKTVVNTYVTEAEVPGLPFPASSGNNFIFYSDSFSSASVRPLRSSVTTLQGGTFSAYANTYDAQARALSTTKSASGIGASYSKTDTTAFYDLLSSWMLGQVQSSTTGSTVVSSSTFSALGQPITESSFGKLQSTFTYNTDGTLATVKDGNNNVTTLSSWKRGIPQTVTFPVTADQPTAVSKAVTVDDNGWIKTSTDENTYTTTYTYDKMGRLATMAYPTGDSTVWNTTTQTFVPVVGAEYGIPGGHWKQTVSTGNARKETYFDALWRPLVTRAYDNVDTANTTTFNVTRYDVSGHAIYASYPMRTLSSYTTPTLGMRTTYDALDRATRVDQDSESGAVLITTTDYLTGFQTRVTNPRGKITTTSYMAYDQPTMDWPVAITHPVGAFTNITRDVFGKPTALLRHNIDNSEWKQHYYVYDAFQRLCKQTDVETGTTAMGYDEVGNLIWSASGLSWAPAAPCNYTAANTASRRVDRTYDARNRLKSLSFPVETGSAHGNGDQTWNYTADNLPTQISTWNIPAAGVDAKETRNVYAYNRRRLMASESLDVPAWYTYGLGYGYDQNGNLTSLSYPSGHTVTYTLNALGQATKVASATAGVTYASNIAYYPNGGISGFTYGNGIVHTMTQNVRQLPATNVDAGVLNLGYTFDANGNVAGITDGVQANHNRTMQYDDLDRLVQATSPVFGTDPVAVYAYDTLDNLKRVKTNGRDTYYCYNANNRVDFLRTGSDCASSPAATSLTYDLQGNVLTKAGQGTSRGFVFDYGNRLREATLGGTSQERYRYDGYGRRVIASRLTGAANEIGVIFSQYANNGQLLYQENVRTAVYKDIDYIYLSGSQLAQREVPIGGGTAVVKYQHTDALGSPVAVTSSTGTVLERMDFEAYGQRIGGTLKDGPGYTGHVLDTATGMNYMQQRYYDPGIGRFLSVDPVTANSGTGANFNRYWYANNNPYKFTDPDGRDGQLFWTAPDQVTFTVPWTMTGVPTSNFTAATVNAQIAQDFSGAATVNGVNVTITAQGVYQATGGPGVNTVNVVPDTAGVTKSGRSETNAIGGNKVTVGDGGTQAATKETVSHELGGHAGG